MPSSDFDAHTKFMALAENYLMEGPASPPTPRVAAFVEEMLSIWHEAEGDYCRSSPWKWPAGESASGPTWRCESKFSEWRIATAVVAALAEKHGLNWHDPQYPELNAGVRAIWDRHPSVAP